MKTNSYKMIQFRLSAAVFSALCLSVVSWGCVKDEPAGAAGSQPAEISFSAKVNNKSSMATRVEEGLIPVNPDDFGNTSFYIYEKGIYTDANDPTGYKKASVAPYWVASGVEGQLNIMEGHTRLNWFAANTPHDFWSWTWPLGERDYSDVDIDHNPEDEVLVFIDSDFPLPGDKTDSKSALGTRAGDDEDDDEEPGTPGESADPAKTWRNGEALERLVGATTERPYVFNQDGRYVPLTYKHLVSKIILGEFVLVDNTGASQKDLKARITFYGMPKRAMFFPLPADVDDHTVAPYVVIDPTDPYGKKPDTERTTEEAIKQAGPFKDYDLNEYLTFYITNEGGDDTNTGTNPDADSNVHRDMFYICPEVDFSQLEYKVEFVEFDKDTNSYIPHTKYGTRGGYFGNFKSVQFQRETEDGSSAPTTDRVLHAGEVMVLNMMVYQKSGPGAGVWIRNWDSEKLKSAMHHVHKGIYSDAEAAAFRETIGTSTTSSSQKDDAYYIYGEDEYNEDGEVEHVIHIYGDISVSSYHFRLYDNKYEDGSTTHYVLDGMGYTLTFTNTSTVDPTPYEFFLIGDVRDLYVSNGIVTIYIDSEGYICRMDEETGKYVRTEEHWTSNETRIYFEV